MITPSYPKIEELLQMVGDTGKRLNEIDACEGAAGNISLYIGWDIETNDLFPNKQTIPLPVEVPELSGNRFLVSGSGCRLREISADPERNLGLLEIGEDGKTGILCLATTCHFQRLTSEWNTHLAIHRDQILLSNTIFHAVVHGQPRYITFLSHIPAYRDEEFLNQKLFRWEAETIVSMPQGIGVVPFLTPGSDQLMAATCAAMREHKLVVWAKHGVISRSETSPKHALDLIDYIETAAHFEYLNLASGHPAEGLVEQEVREIRSKFINKSSG